MVFKGFHVPVVTLSFREPWGSSTISISAVYAPSLKGVPDLSFMLRRQIQKLFHFPTIFIKLVVKKSQCDSHGFFIQCKVTDNIFNSQGKCGEIFINLCLSIEYNAFKRLYSPLKWLSVARFHQGWRDPKVRMFLPLLRHDIRRITVLPYQMRLWHLRIVLMLVPVILLMLRRLIPLRSRRISSAYCSRISVSLLR